MDSEEFAAKVDALIVQARKSGLTDDQIAAELISIIDGMDLEQKSPLGQL